MNNINITMNAHCSLIVWAALMAAASADEPTIRVDPPGERHVLFANEHGGHEELTYFPDEAPALLTPPGAKPCRFLLVANDYTVLMEGPTPENIHFGGIVFEPTRQGRAFDSHYRGITSVYSPDPKRLLGFYHAEQEITTGRRWSVGLAISHDDGRHFKKVGQILTPAPGELPSGNQGIGDVCVIENAEKDYLYAYYTNISRNPESCPTSICLARCRIGQTAKLNSWQKYTGGKADFGAPGIGGAEVPVLMRKGFEISQPHVIYLGERWRYLMVCCVMSWPDFQHKTTKDSGIYLCQSSDGIHWSEKQRLVEGFPIPLEKHEYTAHPCLYLPHVTDNTAKGWLLYCFSDCWRKEPNAPYGQPHHMCYREIKLTLAD